MTSWVSRLVSILLLASGTALAEEEASLTLESTLYFAGLEGERIEVAAGEYAVTSAEEGQLTLTSGAAAHPIAADEAVHLAELETPSASLAEFEGEFILRLHFPDGSGRQAVGSASGVGERGTSPRAYDRGYCPRGFSIDVSGSEARCRRKYNYWKNVGNPSCLPPGAYRGSENDQGYDLCDALGGTFKGPAIACVGSTTLVRRRARDLCRVRAWRWDYTNMAVRR